MRIVRCSGLLIAEERPRPRTKPVIKLTKQEQITKEMRNFIRYDKTGLWGRRTKPMGSYVLEWVERTLLPNRTGFFSWVCGTLVSILKQISRKSTISTW